MSPWTYGHLKEEMGIAVILDMLKSYLCVTSVFSTGKQILCIEDPRGQILVMKRSSFSVL